jgi:hypothetical protein
MEDNIKFAVEEYQCPGCISGSNTSCYKKSNNSVSCGGHMAGTVILSQGKIFLGMPKGFNRLGCSFGSEQQLKIEIHEKFNEEEVFNVVCWKYLNEHGHTLVRGLRPRKNEPFLHIFLEDCREKIGGVEITKEEIEKMD